jgi:FemAB-related protein (PEP-CTERM system-associated)
MNVISPIRINGASNGVPAARMSAPSCKTDLSGVRQGVVSEDPEIRRIDDSERDAWDQYVLRNPRGTAYQLFSWGKSVQRAYRFRPAYWVAESAKGICGVMPLVEMKGLFGGGRIVSLPYCDSGGILADDDGVVQALYQEASRGALDHRGSFVLRSTEELAFAGRNRTGKVRMLLELPGDSERLLSGLKAKVRSQVRKPIRDGLSARMGGRELIPEFYRIFSRNMRDLGSPVHSREWFDAITVEYGDRARVAVVYTPAGEATAAGIALFHSATVSLPWASSLRSHNHLNANMLLYWTFLAYAADHGYRTFDFGRSSPGEGTWRFKQQWGAAPQPLYWYEISEGRNRSQGEARDGESAGRRIAAGVWRRLPECMANLLGPRIRKYISL